MRRKKMKGKIFCRDCTKWMIIGMTTVCIADKRNHISCNRKRQKFEKDYDKGCPDFEPKPYK